jgi:ketosteroid isomerase-like protein
MEGSTASSSRRALLAAVVATAAALAFTAEPAVAETCAARPVVDGFLAALNRGDLDAVDELFAREGEGWVWYFANDRAGRRLGPASRRRDTLRAYFAARIRRHETLRLVRCEESENGNFTFVLRRRADDLRPVVRVGKGWVSCSSGKLGVWGLGGAPAPASFGPCPVAALPLEPPDVAGATAAVLRFVRDVYAELVPSLDVAGTRVTRAGPAVGNVLGYSARVRCGREVQRRTIVVAVRFPRVRASEPASAGAFYVSRTRAGWLVWRFLR